MAHAFKLTLVYRVSSRIARATQRNPVSKKTKKKKKVCLGKGGAYNSSTQEAEEEFKSKATTDYYIEHYIIF